MDKSRYYTDIAAAFIRGKLQITETDSVILWNLAKQSQLKLHKFKRNQELPRIQAVLGMLKNIQPQSLLDIGTGRGVFLWPLIDAFPTLPITATDIQDFRVADLQAIHDGGFSHIQAQRADVCSLPFANNAFDVVTALETLEHIQESTHAIQEVVRVAKRHAIFSVPSKEDTNPEHLHLLSQDDFHDALSESDVTISFQYVLNHMIVFVTKKV